ncbi:MAG: hypothetical protein JO327_00260 [Nitrososphaeraceae archaeon]|nr:hypothetical protein [Nitrososphaeraceae archaeon]MBV9666539.1 hypothetical protein [Nitrososphaeraceae archaeon]
MMKSTIILAIVATITAVGGVASLTLVSMAISAHALPCVPRHCGDTDDTGHGQSFHDSNGDLHSGDHA